ncbi:MAG: SDR family NAD(P)-dependent oxidoreductase, partial [Rhodospirillales bacterium]|nr:SDR family NAD(P)-dependent oxidoreductase [Acetobacter sp.]
MAEKFAVVTGASSGIGYNLAQVFAENGYDLVIASEGDGIHQAAQDLQSPGVSITPVQVNLASFEGCQQLWQQVESTGRTLDAIAINAGVGVGGLFADTDLEKEINLVRLNCESTVHIAKYAVRKMTAQGQGKILITSSIAGEMVAPKEAVYAASKAFDLSFAKSLRFELQDTGITVTALQPGPTNTNFFERADLGDTKAGTEGKQESQPYEVARQGFEALMKGDEHVYTASWKTKVEGSLLGVVALADAAIATSGTAERGAHIWDPVAARP